MGDATWSRETPLNAAPPFQRWGEHLAIQLPGARAIFTTRRGGFSTGRYASLNLGKLTGDRGPVVERNRATLREALGAELCQTRQVHGRRVLRVTRPPQPASGELPEADGQATPVREVAPMVLVADCLPIAVAGGGAVTMLHAGWRGLAAGIVQEGVRALRELGAEEPLAAAIGPGAGPCCYEVSEEVHAIFEEVEGYKRRGPNLDLKAIARRQLGQLGIREIHDAGMCTICAHPSLFFSHRRDRGVTGRQAGIAWLR